MAWRPASAGPSRLAALAFQDDRRIVRCRTDTYRPEVPFASAEGRDGPAARLAAPSSPLLLAGGPFADPGEMLVFVEARAGGGVRDGGVRRFRIVAGSDRRRGGE